MKDQKKFLFASLILTFLFFIFTLGASAELLKDHIEYTYNGGTIVCNDWTLDTESGLMTIKSVGTNSWNETGSGSHANFDKHGGWSKHRTLIKKVVLEGEFNKISNNAFVGCSELREIVITKSISQIDNSAFKNCPKLSEIYINDNMKMAETADLRHVSFINFDILRGTAVKKIFVSNSDSFEVHEKGIADSITEFIGESGSASEKYAKSKGLTFTPVPFNLYVDIMMNGSPLDTLSVEYGSKLISFEGLGNGKAIAFFSDKECTTAYDNTSHITENTVIYAKELLKLVGISVRTEEYKGLRAIYELDLATCEGIIGQDILRVGALIGLKEYALNNITIETDGITAISVYENGIKTGETLGAPKDGKVRFAVSAVGFEDLPEKEIERCLQNIVFRGFAEIYDKTTDKIHIRYTDAVGTTLKKASLNFLEGDMGTRATENQKEFVRATVSLTAGKGDEVRYSKKELMALIAEIYNDNGKLLVGEEISPKHTAADVVAEYMEVSGEAPSIIGMDLACYGIPLMTADEEYRTEFLQALIDYCRDGGIITASSHFQNPTGNWTEKGLCRGFLGGDDLWEELLTEGTQLNREFKRELSVDAAFLRELSNNDVPILWRPFHEMNGGWFWWCVKQENGYLVDARSFHEVWKYVYNYYENELGLTNLIWVYSPNNDTGTLVDVEYCYPGDDYVDMVGLDWYSSGGYEIGSNERAYLRMMDYGMPTALTEYGGSDGGLDALETWNDIQKMYADGMKLVYIMTWTGSNSFPDAGKCDEFMAKPDTLNVKEVFSMFKAYEAKK